MNFRKLLAILIYYGHNMKILHWKVKDIHFDEYHEITSEYYQKLDEYVDKIAEIGITYDEQPLDLMEAFKVLDNDKEDYKILKASEDYSSKDVIDNINVMFKDIMKSLCKLLDEDKVEDNPGVRSELETMYSWFDIECNYKNKRRS